MHDGSRLPIRVLLARLVILGLLPVAVLGAWAVVNTIAGQRDETERSVLELSRALASAVDSELNATLQSLSAMGRSSALEAGDVPAFYEQARNEVAAHPEWSAVVLTDGTGRLLFRSVEPLGATDSRIIDPDSLARTIRTGAPTVGRLLPGRRQPAFPVRLPVFLHGQLAYVITAAVLPDRMLEVLKRQRPPQGWVIAVFDSANVRVARVAGAASSVGGSAMPELAALFGKDGAQGVGVTHTLEGEEVFTGFTRLKPDDWVVAVGAPTAGTKQALMRSIAWYLAGVLGSLVACAILARRISRRIGQDVRRLRDEAVQLSEGTLVQAGRSEIAELDDIALALEAASKRLDENARAVRDALAGADAAARAKDQFLAVLGHELRNPLAPMLTALHLLDMKASDATARERQIMRRQIDHMRRLVDDLLDVSRITRGKFEIRREPVLLQSIVERSVETMGAALAAREPPLELDVERAELWVSGDATRLVQALANLLSNALRYGGQGRIRLRLEAGDEVARLAVSDEGVGMTPETLAQVFEPFFQAPQGTERQIGGLGLGLAIVHSIVKLHGGSVLAGSAGLGQGSWFTIELPTRPSPLLAPDVPARQARRRKGAVVVVDDNADAREMVAEALRTAGHEVECMANAYEALARIPSLNPDVAILDIGMPGMDGYQLARSLRDANSGWSGRLIALTGYGQEADKARSLNAGFSLHLTKPVEVAELLGAVESLIRPPPANAETH
jgi:signal transduction histidine kinase/CheY-like chemotaxis protein